MGTKYCQLGMEERCEIANLHSSGSSIRQIASALDRQPSTIAREIKRNQSRQKKYQPMFAEQLSRARRWTGSRLERDDSLRQEVLSGLKKGWSPEQVSGRMARQFGQKIISHESIYRFIYAQLIRTNDYRWRHFLPRGKSKRGWRGRKGGSPASFIAHRRSLRERPKDAQDRQTPGHWEADLMLFRVYGQAILTMHERRSRLLIAVRPPSKSAEPVARAMRDLLALLPPQGRRTVTFDNGTEFALHYRLHDLNIETFFCDTYSPWQKGGIENAIGRMRRTLPRKTDLATISDQRFMELIRA